MDWKSWVMTKLQAAVGFYFVNESTTGGASANDTVRGNPAAPPEQTGTVRVRRMWPFGIRSRVPQGVECITVGPMGSETQKVMIAAESKTFGPGNLSVGDTAIYSSAHKEGAVCYIKLDKDGAISVLPKPGSSIVLDKDGKVSVLSKDGQRVTIDAGAGADVVVNGGTLRVARAGDSVGPNGDMGLWMNAVDAAFAVVLAAGIPIIQPVAPPGDIGVITSGADRFKA